MTMVMPVQESNQQLKTDKEAKEAQLQQAKKGADNSKINELTNSISQEKVIKNEILSMFANEKTFDTLLIDVNSLITYSKTKLKSYQPQIVEAILINDNSLGASVNNKLQRQAVNLEIEGSFAESMRLIRDLERFQPLLLMKDMSIEAIGSRASNISLSASEILSKPKTELKIRFRLDAISPYGVEAIVANNTPSK
jgi:type IV pilus assembly protein PilO/type IV pilus assembly protein PilQ